jgi:hypothetical protein
VTSGQRPPLPRRDGCPSPARRPLRALARYCAREDLSPDLLRLAAQQAIRRGLVTKAELGDVEEALRPFGGLGR